MAEPVGLRIEHPQELINSIQVGDAVGGIFYSFCLLMLLCLLSNMAITTTSLAVTDKLLYKLVLCGRDYISAIRLEITGS